MVYPRIVPLRGYDIASRRPIGDVTLAHRLYEDPTRIAGVRSYETGDPLNRIHWRASARTGQLHSKVYDPSSLTGATLVVDFHRDSYPARGEPHRSDLAATAAASLAFAVSEIGQQIGLVTNAGDAAERLTATNFAHLLNQDSSDMADQRLAQSVRADAQVAPVERRRILHVPTEPRRRSLRANSHHARPREINDGLTFPELLIEAQSRLPRDATVIALVPSVSDQAAIALGNLKRLGYAVSVVLVLPTEDDVPTSYGRLAAQGIRDVRPLKNEETLPDMCMAEVNADADGAWFEMAQERKQPDWFDFAIAAISPVLIMGLVGSLAFFLLDVLYGGIYAERLYWTLFFFVVGSVLVARIAIVVDPGRAKLYGLMLAGAVFLAALQYAAGTIGPLGWLICLVIILVVLWSSNKLVWNCTFLDENGSRSGTRVVGGVVCFAGGRAGGESAERRGRLARLVRRRNSRTRRRNSPASPSSTSPSPHSRFSPSANH